MSAWGIGINNWIQRGVGQDRMVTSGYGPVILPGFPIFYFNTGFDVNLYMGDSEKPSIAAMPTSPKTL